MSEPRLLRLRARLAGLECPAALIQNPESVRYLTGFSGSSAVLAVTGDRALFLTDSRYRTQAREECAGVEFRLIASSAGYADATAELVRELGSQVVGFEADFLTVSGLRELQEKAPGITLRPLDNLVLPLRRIKDPEELRRIEAACAIADRAFARLLPQVRAGAVERELAAELEYLMKREGAEREAFETIVASGVRSALPHGRATGKRLEAGDLVTFDFGARLEGYCSDITRTVVVGRATDRQREVYGVVREALAAATAAIRAGADARTVDAVARDLIAARGFGAHFGHGLGHGLGRAVHDHPGFSPRAELTLEAGMVLTVEPGIYIEGWGGVRIEDDVVVTADGCRVLTGTERELMELA